MHEITPSKIRFDVKFPHITRGIGAYYMVLSSWL